MNERLFAINLERSRVYWDYYKLMFLVFSFAFMSGIIATSMIYNAGGIDILFALGVIFLLFLFIILLSALMSLSIWRHENKHLDELIEIELEDLKNEMEMQPQQGMPLV